MVHGMLARMGEPLPAPVIAGRRLGGRRGAQRLGAAANGARWDSAWIQLIALHEYDERITLYFDDSSARS